MPTLNSFVLGVEGSFLKHPSGALSAPVKVFCRNDGHKVGFLQKPETNVDGVKKYRLNLHQSKHYAETCNEIFPPCLLLLIGNLFFYLFLVFFNSEDKKFIKIN